jgi:hypothetical protein
LSIKVNCKYCWQEFAVPPSRVWRSNYCSDNCRQRAKLIINAVKNSARKRNCLQCNKSFIPRPYQIKTGVGKYCSANCRNIGNLTKLLSEESKIKSKESYKKNLSAGKIKHKTGKDHPRWKGGKKECIERAISSGVLAERVKKYRKQNPEKVREWSKKRLSKITGRLPRGTVLELKEKQENKCVYCKTDISLKFHVDHIIPLSKGGKHEKDNIQILCPSCNVKKSNKLDFKLP